MRKKVEDIRNNIAPIFVKSEKEQPRRTSFFAILIKKIAGVLRFVAYGTIVLIFMSAFLVIASALYFNNKYKDIVAPNVYFNNEEMAGKSLEDVKAEVQNKLISVKKELILKYSDKEVKVKISDLGFSWDKEKTLGEIYDIGKEGSYVNRSIVLASSFLYKKEVLLQYTLDNEVATDYLKELATTIDKEPVDGRFDIQNGKVKNFFIGSDGQKLLIFENIEVIKNALLKQSDNVELKIKITEAKSMDDMEKMGVKELIATGVSNFAGSPPNRVHNIGVGAQVFNGILVKPGENFSFIPYLGEVSAKTGYLPELVIKEDKTIPEYGGGLCQVSTTFFRAAINAGLPIIERSAHAYRVYYYEPAGFDATIYQPKPDLIFKNDTNKYILIQTRIVGVELFVDFYGTSDGRKVEVSKSTVYNYVQPGEPILTETTELALGEKKQTDTAHVGADAYFTRKITYADGKVKDDRFDSHYIPWRAKFLVGKEPEAGKAPEEVPPEDSDSTDNKSSDTNNSNNEAPITP